jgi:hypothetical protein
VCVTRTQNGTDANLIRNYIDARKRERNSVLQCVSVCGAFKKKLGAKLQVCYIVIVPRHQRFLLFDAADSELRLNAHWL